MRVLPLLEARRAELEKCVFCPKLCRSACPVSNAEPRETVTPWGKMSMAWMAAHGDVPLNGSHAAPAWACTGCFACREWCDHRNPVTGVLLDTRDALARRGVAPGAARRVIRQFGLHNDRTRVATRRLGQRSRAGARDALLVGCGYVRAARREAGEAVEATTALVGPIALVEDCCGLPLRLAGDRDLFARHALAVARSLERYDRVIVLDAGCALALKRLYAETGLTVAPKVDLLVQIAARSLSALSPVNGPPEPVRWHDPCQLGRGMGVYEDPRAVLARVLGRSPAEFDERGEQAVCSGAGGLLPSTMPEVARGIASARLEAHARAGGGRVVTACASSL
ncbi:MAG TPA: (Fe-S)-binding protein, partial [Polyangiaceae bacterium]|nr:(Fe-S)-binding protein [Polyangiaceae bacterium]